jgi:hypothetical protein
MMRSGVRVVVSSENSRLISKLQSAMIIDNSKKSQKDFIKTNDPFPGVETRNSTHTDGSKLDDKKKAE